MMTKNEGKYIFITLLLCLMHLFSVAQTDTIFRKDGKLIPCTITLVNETAVFFKDKKDYGFQLDLTTIAQYSKHGVVTLVNVPSEVLLHTQSPLDTTHKALFVDNVNINNIDVAFCELVHLDVGFTGGNAYIYIDYGQFIEKPQEVIIRNNAGKAVYFNSIIGALNFMVKNGWEYINQSVSSNSSIAVGKTATIYKILLKRKH